MLLQHGSNPDAYEAFQHQTVLMWAAGEGHTQVVDMLLAAGADPNRPFIGQMHSTGMCCDAFVNATPFYRAAIAADVDTMTLLLEYGADVAWTPQNVAGAARGANANVGRTALVAAMNGGRGVPMSGGPGDIREGRPPPFREPANRDPADAVRVLLTAGADPDVLGPDGSAAIHQAALSGRLPIIRALAQGGARLDLPDRDGLTALQIVENMPADRRPPRGFCWPSPQSGTGAVVARRRSPMRSSPRTGRCCRATASTVTTMPKCPVGCPFRGGVRRASMPKPGCGKRSSGSCDSA